MNKINYFRTYINKISNNSNKDIYNPLFIDIFMFRFSVMTEKKSNKQMFYGNGQTPMGQAFAYIFQTVSLLLFF